MLKPGDNMNKNKNEYTIEEISRMEEHAELINGELVVAEKSSTEHNRTVVSIVCAIANYINEGKSSGEVFSSNIALYCNDIDDRCSAEFYLPDIMVVCNPDIIDNEGIHGTPDMVIEVVSPESKQQDYSVKLSTYKIIGVREYWIVDLTDGLVTVYLKEDKYTPHHYFLPGDVPVSIYLGRLSIKITLPSNNASWQVRHAEVIKEFLKYLNENSDDFIFKGGTALMLCYGLDRFSEEVVLDGVQANIDRIIDDFCNIEGYSYRNEVNTAITKRYIIYDSDAEHPLKVEVSCRRKTIDPDEVNRIQGVSVYKIEYLCLMKVNAFCRNEKKRDLYDLTFICNNFWEQLSVDAKSAVREAFSYKNLQYFTYLIKKQADNLVDNSKLAASFLLMYDRLGLVAADKDLSELKDIIRRFEIM